jgi:hypothetical protein
MAIDPVSSQRANQTAEVQRAGAADTVKTKPKVDQARSEDAYAVNISEEAQKKAQETRQNAKAAETHNKPSK